jgi:hypothetical protein
MKVLTAALAAFLLVGLLFLAACGGGGASSSTNSSSAAPITGNWSIALQTIPSTPTGTPKSTGTLSGFLSGTKDAVTGRTVYTGTTCAGIGNVSGTVTGSKVALSVSPTGLNISLTGTLAPDQSSMCGTSAGANVMSGNYTLLASGCGKPETGSWTGCPVQPLNGTLSGTFTSNSIGNPVFPVTAAISQGSSDGASSAPLTGTLTAGSTGSACFPPGTTVNISGLISGEGVVIGLANSAGDPFGQITGTWPNLDPAATPPITISSLTGKYNIPPQGPRGAPCSKGDSGKVCFPADAAFCQTPGP